MKRVGMMRALMVVAGLAAGLAGTAVGQATLTVTVDKVHSDKGVVVAGLCADPKASFPGYCTGGQASAPANNGTVEVTFADVKPGIYALQIFHDENANGMPNIPPEGYAYGNNQPFPPSFEKSSIKVEGSTKTSTTMLYIQDMAAAGLPKQGSKGVAPMTGVTRVDVRDDGLYAELYLPQSDKKLPVIIAIGGSEGGLDTMSRMAASLNRQGYAVLALAYWAELGLPQTLENVPLEYFDRAIAWLKARPEIDAQRIGAIGGSRGSEAVLLLGSRNKDVRAVMAFAPSGVMWQGLNFSDFTSNKPAWTAGGKGLPFFPPDQTKYGGTGPMRPMFESALAKGAKPEAEIAVEKINGPVLLLSGEADALWPSTPMAEAAMARLKAKKFGHPYQHLSYAGAGHLVFMGDPGLLPPNFSTPDTGMIRMGGSPEANAKAWADNWPKTLKFFDDALKGQR